MSFRQSMFRFSLPFETSAKSRSPVRTLRQNRAYVLSLHRAVFVFLSECESRGSRVDDVAQFAGRCVAVARPPEVAVENNLGLDGERGSRISGRFTATTSSHLDLLTIRHIFSTSMTSLPVRKTLSGRKLRQNGDASLSVKNEILKPEVQDLI